MAEIIELPLDKLDLAEHDLRAELDDQKLDDLYNDIRDNGLIYPLIVKRKGERWEVVDGGRRLRCMQRLGLIVARSIELAEDGPPPESIKLKANLLREDNSDAEIALWLGELVEKYNYSLEQLCQTVGRSESFVNERYALLHGCPEVFEALGKREINISQAKVLNACKDDGWRKLGLHYAITDHVSAAKLREWIVRNNPVVVTGVQPEQPIAAQSPDGPAVGPGIVCDWCGGHKDPQNMVSIWLHRWEWSMVQQVLAKAHEETGQSHA